jgi:hypothetical protein
MCDLTEIFVVIIVILLYGGLWPLKEENEDKTKR